MSLVFFQARVNQRFVLTMQKQQSQLMLVSLFKTNVSSLIKQTRLKFVDICLLFGICMLMGCGGTGNSFMEEFELPGLGSDSDSDRELEMPPGLVKPKASDKYIIPGSKASMQAAAMSSYVLPEKLDMKISREGNIAWLKVGAEPLKLWPHLKLFLEGYGFQVVRENPTYGMMETNWLERDLKDEEVLGMRMRDKFRVRLERDANAVTNIYITNRKFLYQDQAWKANTADVETEIDLLYDFSDYLRRLQAAGKTDVLPELAAIEIPLDVRDIQGVPVLEIGHIYSKAWRALALALDRAGINVRDADRSRGIFLIDYNQDDPNSLASDYDENYLIQIHLLSRRDSTVITLHPNRARGRPLPYELAYEVLKRIVWAYT